MSGWGPKQQRSNAIRLRRIAWPRKRSGFIHHLAPHGMAGFVLANGPAAAGSSNQSGEGDIRRALIEADLVDCMVALPGQLFYSTQIPVCLWFLVKSKAARVIKSSDNSTPDSFRERRRETLFIDARKMGKLIDRVRRDLTTFRKCVVARFKAAASRLNVRLFGGEAGPGVGNLLI